MHKFSVTISENGERTAVENEEIIQGEHRLLEEIQEVRPRGQKTLGKRSGGTEKDRPRTRRSQETAKKAEFPDNTDRIVRPLHVEKTGHRLAGGTA